MTHRLILVGAGHAHLSVLQALAVHHPAGLDVVLITPTRHQNYSGMLPGWVAGHYTQADCRVELTALAAAAGVHLLLGQVAGMDAARGCVVLADARQLDYDGLSLDVGSETDTSWLEVLGDKLLPVKPLDAFFAAWPGILASAQNKPGYRLAVVGGGAAGVELALAAQHAFTRAHVDGRVDLVASESGLLPGHNTRVQARVQRLATQAGLTRHFVRGVGADEGVMLAGGQVLPADCVIAATGARAPVWLAMSKLALDAQGFVRVDAHHRSVSHPNVFAVGDVCSRSDVALSRSGVHAVHAGPVLADNLLAVVQGRALKPYRPKARSLYLLACGPRYAVASWGRWSAEGQWVWRWKDWIDRRFIARFSTRLAPEATSLLEKTP